MYLVVESTAAARRGDFAVTDSLMAEAEAVIDVTGMRLPNTAEVVAGALRGREVEPSGSIGAAAARWASAILHNGLGRYEEAREAALEATSDRLDMFASVWALPELIEATARSGARGAAHEALERLTETTRAAGTDFGLGVEARSRALLSDRKAAERLYSEAIDRLGRTRMLPDLARAHLLYGEWLRREGRRADARVQLRTAHDLFDGMGMEAFAERARRELVATGERVRRRKAETRNELTPQERQIAHLARDGLSNPEIGARLFLSPRTVEWHLRKVFSKLGIRSRRELTNALAGVDSELVPA
jgi:DNA-binding CsgD family transcriptional regulator